MRIPLLKYVPFVVIVLLLIKGINQSSVLLDYLNLFVSIIAPIFFGILIAYLLNPGVKYLCNRFHLKRGLSIIVVYLIFSIVLLMLCVLIIPTVTIALTKVVNELPTYIAALRDATENITSLKELNLDDLLASNSDTIISSVTKFFSTGLYALSSVLGIIYTTFVSILISIYVLKDLAGFKKLTKKTIFSFMKEDSAKTFTRFLEESDEIFGKFMGGKLIESLILSIISGAGLFLIGVPYGIPMGFLMGFANIIPYVGPFIGAVPPILLAFVEQPSLAIWVIILTIAVQQIDNIFIGPKILGGRVGISDFTVFVSVLIGGAMFGMLGMVFSVPIASIIKLVYDRYLNKKLEEKNIVIE